MGYYQQAPYLESWSPSSLYDEEAALPLIAAARILEAAAKDISSRAPKEASDLYLLAGAAYAMHGNFPSARAVLGTVVENLGVATDELWAAVCVCCPSFVGIAIPRLTTDGPAKSLIETLQYYLEGGAAATEADLRILIRDCLKQASATLDIVMLSSARVALEHLIELSVLRVTHSLANPINSEVVRKLAADGVYTFLPPQLRALYGSNLLGDGNVLLTLPTSTGKTLLGELCIFSSLAVGPGLACYVVPYIALGTQVGEAMKRHAPDDIRVSILVGGFSATAPLEPQRRKEVVVATPERFDGMLRALGTTESLKVVVVDEAHLIENGTRGARLEGLLTRLRLVQRQGRRFRVVLLSAVLRDTIAIQEWLDISDNGVFSERWRPTARRIALWNYDQKLQWIFGTDPLKPSERAATEVLGSRPLLWPKPMYPTDAFGLVKKQIVDAYQNVALLARTVRREFGAPVLIVCMTKAATRGLAETIAVSEIQVESVHPDLDALFKSIRRSAPFLLGMINLIKRGVVFHNASLPVDIRHTVEAVIRKRLVNFVCATTTLAEGVDLPFRVTILFDWLMGFGDRQRPMRPLLFRNIAGRCGRAGSFTEGDTIIFENVLGNLRYTNPVSRGDAIRSLVQEPPRLVSTISQDLSKEEEAARDAIFESQFLAAIPENAANDNLSDAFVGDLYAAHTGEADKARRIVERTRQVLLDSTDMPFATAASPLRLTPLGEAANLTGFSPSSCREIMRSLSHVDQKWSLPNLGAFLLVQLGTLHEQSNVKLREVITKRTSRFYAKPDDFPIIIAQWLQGTPLHEIFVQLPKVAGSGAKDLPRDWATGSGSDHWSRQFDHFADFAQAVIGGYLPWLLRASGALARFVGDSAYSVPWHQHAERLEKSRDVDAENIDASLSGGNVAEQ